MLFLRKCVLYESVVDAAVVVNLVNIVAFGLYSSKWREPYHADHLDETNRILSTVFQDTPLIIKRTVFHKKNIFFF